MYGGYGNLWNQAAASAQWPTGNLPVQNQNQQMSMPATSASGGVPATTMGNAATQSYQNQQQNNAMQLGSSGVGVGMANYGNLGMQSTGNPFMDYANSALGYNQSTMANAWNSANSSNLQFQQQVYMTSKNLMAFPGGRPPLPPGPPPPDKPKEINLPPVVAPSKTAPPPPPPPPPPSQQQQQQQQHLSGFESSNSNAAASLFPNILKPEDAYNLLKSAAALGLLPGNGPLAPLTSLNVSEELFGSKNSGLGIPGLDGAEDVPVAKSPQPEVVDLEKDPAEEMKKDTQQIKEKNEMKHVTEAKTDNPWTTAERRGDSNNKSSPFPKKEEKKEIVWELRPEVKNRDWALPDKNSSANDLQGKKEVPTPRSHLLPENKNNVTGKEDKKLDKSNAEEPRVRIPLEATDGQHVIYDRKTLKQFDQKFREWENQFEKWKRDNESHPNRAIYKQYLDQWNLWREQLVEQRRSILETMTNVRKEILLSKFESMNPGGGDDRFSETDSVGASSTSSMNKSNLDKTKPDEKQWNQNESENPFQIAFGNFGGPTPKAIAIPTPTMRAGNVKEMPKNDDHSAANKERVRRDGGGNSRNIFDDNFNNDHEHEPDDNPFLEKSSKPFQIGGNFGAGDGPQSAPKLPKQNTEESTLPFEWALPSQKAQNKNPFDMSSSQSNNPFMQPSGPNPFEMAPQQKLPSLMDFIKQTNLSFSVPTTRSAQQPNSSNPFMMERENNSTSDNLAKPLSRSENQVERISRDPQGNQQQQPKTNVIITPPSTIRLEANPIGMPLLRAAANQEDELRAEEEDDDQFSHLFSRDRGPAEEEDCSNNVQFDDEDFVEDAEVIDYGAGNSMDDMDFPRGEKATNEDAANDEDFCLEDTEVIDYSERSSMPYPDHPQHDEFYEGGYPPGYDMGYPPFHPMRGRGRGGFPHPRGRGHFRGPAPFMEPPYYGVNMPPMPRPGFGPMLRGRGRFPPPHQANWYHHDDRGPPLDTESGSKSPEIVELSPSPPPEPRVKIAPPRESLDGDRAKGGRRSLSGDRDRRRHSKERTRSRSRDRIERVSRRRDDSSSDMRGRRADSPSSSRRDRERSPETLRRQDERRTRHRAYGSHRGGRSSSKSRSRSPARDTGVGNSVIRNPLFPSASSMGVTASNQASNPPPPRYQAILIDDILNKPSRAKRPQRLVIIMRGLPGSGKSHIVKLIKEREVEMGGKAPRILSLDNYFITETEKKEKDPATGAEVKKTVLEYEYDEEREPLYRAQLVRQFKKTIDDGYFSFVIVDGVNEYVRQFEEMATFATQKRFQVYVAEIEESVDLCVKRNTHKRTKDDLLKIQRRWERTPGKFTKLDTTSLLQDEAVDDDVEMEDVSDVEADANNEKVKTPPPTPAERGKIGPQVEDIEDEDSGDHILTSAITSKWDTMEQSQEKLNKLDGLAKRKRNADNSEAETATSIEMWLTGNLPEDYGLRRQTVPGEKRVRWADIEERREQEKMRQMGFVVGHTDWNRMMDPTFGGSALTKTKFI